MNKLKTIVGLLLLTLWLPATSHCYLEIAGLIPKDDCCAKGETSPASKGDPCENGCKLVEKAGYKVQDNQLIAVPSVMVFTLLFFRPPAPEEISVSSSNPISAWPPDTLQLPQFVVSTALPVRAPSFAS